MKLIIAVQLLVAASASFKMDLTCPIPPTVGLGLLRNPGAVTRFSESSSTSLQLGSVLLFLLGLQDESSAVITNVSVIQSWNWFFHLSAFESVFLAFVVAQVKNSTKPFSI